ncbi:MAG: ATP-binding protein [Deferribacterales bacterium]
MNDTKRALLLFLLLCSLSIAVASTVMTYWFMQTRGMFMDRMEEIVHIRKSFFESIYAAYSSTGDKEALKKTLGVIENSFDFITAGEYTCDFIVRSKDSKYMLLSREDCKEVSTDIINMASIDRSAPLARALAGNTGRAIGRDHHGNKVLAAYDYIDLEGMRFGIVAKTDYSSMLIPKLKAAVSAAFIALVIIIGGGLGFYRFTSRNLFDLKKANEDLKIMADVYNSVNDYSAYIDTNMKYKSANRAFCEMFDTDQSAISSRYLGDFVSTSLKDGLLLPSAKKCLAGKNVRVQQWVNLGKKGDFFAEIKMTPHSIEGVTAGIVMTLTDRTKEEKSRIELVETMEKLTSLTQELEERVKMEMSKRITNERLFFEQKKFADMGQMMNAIAHQWRQPINSVGLYVQLIYESFKDGTLDSDTLENFKSDTLQLVQHMSKTIDDFRSFFDPRTKETNFEAINAVVDTITLVEAQLKHNSIGFTVSCRCPLKEFESCNSLTRPPCEYPETLVCGFSSEFRQVLMNLVQNAKDALSVKTGEKYIQIAVLALKDSVNISISDNGGGIPEDALNKVFDPYFTTKPQGKGTGIGLYMSKMIIEEHMNGKISASNSEEGAVFTIYLPKAKD